MLYYGCQQDKAPRPQPLDTSATHTSPTGRKRKDTQCSLYRGAQQPRKTNRCGVAGRTRASAQNQTTHAGRYKRAEKCASNPPRAEPWKTTYLNGIPCKAVGPQGRVPTGSKIGLQSRRRNICTVCTTLLLETAGRENGLAQKPEEIIPEKSSSKVGIWYSMWCSL